MVKFAPVYMTVYDGPEGVLANLTLTFNITVRETNTYGAGSPHDTVLEITVTA